MINPRKISYNLTYLWDTKGSISEVNNEAVERQLRATDTFEYFIEP